MDQRAWQLPGALLLVLSSGACTAPYLHLSPPIQDAELRDGNELLARVAVSWRGVEQRDGELELTFRCRIENVGATSFTIAPAEFELLDGGLIPHGLSRVDGIPAPLEVPTSLEAGKDATFDLVFALPAGTSLRGQDFASVQLSARLDGSKWTWVTRFDRNEPVYSYYDPYYDPWWGSPYRYHFGAVYCHH